MISKTKKNYNRLKRSVKKNKYIGGITFMTGLHAFFVNKDKWNKLFGEVVKDKHAPSIKDIEKNFNLSGYYLENNTKTLHFIGFDDLSIYNRRLKYNNDWNGKVELEKILNLDIDNEIQDALLSSFFSRDKYDCCVVIDVEPIKSNKYIKLVEKKIIVNIPKEPTLSDELRELRKSYFDTMKHMEKRQAEKKLEMRNMTEKDKDKFEQDIIRIDKEMSDKYKEQKKKIILKYKAQTADQEQIEDLSTDSNEQIDGVIITYNTTENDELIDEESDLDDTTENDELIDEDEPVKLLEKTTQNIITPEQLMATKIKQLTKARDRDLLINKNLLRDSLADKKTKLDKEIEKNHYGMLRNEIIQSYSQKIKNIKKKYSKQQKTKVTLDNDDDAVEDIQLTDDEHNSSL